MGDVADEVAIIGAGPAGGSAGGIAGFGAPAAPATTNFGVYARLTLAVAVGVGIIFWPYANRCGMGLAGYLGAVAAVIVSGGWSAVWTFRHRAGRAHFLSLLLVLWGLILGVLSSWLATWLWSVASRRLPVSLAGQLIVSETIFAIAFGAIYSGQLPQPSELIGMALMVAGVLASLRVFAMRRSAPDTR